MEQPPASEKNRSRSDSEMTPDLPVYTGEVAEVAFQLRDVLGYIQHALPSFRDYSKAGTTDAFNYQPSRSTSRVDADGRLRLAPEAAFTATKIDTPAPDISPGALTS